MSLWVEEVADRGEQMSRTQQQHAYRYALLRYSRALGTISERAERERALVLDAIARDLAIEASHSIVDAAEIIAKTPDRLYVIQQFAYMGEALRQD